MDISVVLCTRNRADQLVPALESLGRLRFDGQWELVIVDNGSKDHTAQVIADFKKRFPHPVVDVYEERPGLGHARNIGLNLSSGRIVAFTDDDCYPAPDWLEWIDRLMREHPHVGYIGGKVPLFDPDDLPVAIQTATRAQWIEPRGFVRPGQIPGANMAFRREILIRVGGFDDRFGAGAPFPAEDVDIQARVSADGWWGYYEPEMVVYHHHRRRGPNEEKRLDLAYDIGRGAYYMKCLLNPRLRLITLRNWYWAVRRQSMQQTVREVKSAARFLGSELGRHRRKPSLGA